MAKRFVVSEEVRPGDRPGAAAIPTPPASIGATEAGWRDAAKFGSLAKALAWAAGRERAAPLLHAQAGPADRRYHAVRLDEKGPRCPSRS